MQRYTMKIKCVTTLQRITIQCKHNATQSGQGNAGLIYESTIQYNTMKIQCVTTLQRITIQCKYSAVSGKGNAGLIYESTMHENTIY